MKLFDLELMYSLIYSIVVLHFIVNVIFGAGVLSDGQKRQGKGEETLFAPVWVWALAVLASGPIALAIYWLIHHSKFSTAEATNKIEPDDSSHEHSNN